MSPTFVGLDLGGATEAVPRLHLLTEQMEHLDEEAQDFASSVRDEIRSLLGSLQWFEQRFARMLRDAGEGKAVEIQSEREPILDAFQRRLVLVYGACKLGHHAERISGRPLPELAESG